jgi:cytochrome c5
MTTLIRASIALLISSAIVACTTALPPPVSPIEVSRAQSRWSDSSMDSLSAGRTVLIKKCSRCHSSPMPAEHESTQWPRIVDDMQARAGLSAEQRRDLERYVVVASQR